MNKIKEPRMTSQKLLLQDLYRKFDRQTADNISFDSKMGIIIGFFALYFVGILIQAIEKPYLLSNILFLVGSIAGFLSVLVLIKAFYPVDYKDPMKIKTSYAESNFQKSQKETEKDLVNAYREAYEANADRLKNKAELCKIGLITFVISITSLFIFIIHSNMTTYQEFGGDDDQSSNCDIVTKGDETPTNKGGEDDEGNCDRKTLGEK